MYAPGQAVLWRWDPLPPSKRIGGDVEQPRWVPARVLRMVGMGRYSIRLDSGALRIVRPGELRAPMKIV